jgi:Ni,Fe-hydrogenase III large subunit
MATLSRVCGICSGVHTLAYGVLAPTARASGLHIDVRRDIPYAAYEELGFQIVADMPLIQASVDPCCSCTDR